MTPPVKCKILISDKLEMFDVLVLLISIYHFSEFFGVAINECYGYNFGTELWTLEGRLTSQRIDAAAAMLDSENWWVTGKFVRSNRNSLISSALLIFVFSLFWGYLAGFSGFLLCMSESFSLDGDPSWGYLSLACWSQIKFHGKTTSTEKSA